MNPLPSGPPGPGRSSAPTRSVDSVVPAAAIVVPHRARQRAAAAATAEVLNGMVPPGPLVLTTGSFRHFVPVPQALVLGFGPIRPERDVDLQRDLHLGHAGHLPRDQLGRGFLFPL